jgi:hypothetical protein
MTRETIDTRPERLDRAQVAIRWFAILAVAVLLVAGCDGAPAAGGSQTPKPEEAFLLDGLRRDAFVDCAPIRTELPPRAIAGIMCRPELEQVDAVALYAYRGEPDLLESYFAILAVNGVEPRSGGCLLGSGGEDTYLPGEDPADPSEFRHGCYSDEAGITYLATFPAFVLAAVHGTPTDMNAFLRWSWLGNLDVPGGPTVWNAGGPMSIEK